MVDSVANTAISTMLRAQSVGTSGSVAALKSNKQAAQAIISQLQQGVGGQSGGNLPQPSMKQVATVAAPATGGTLPRGSLVDLLV